MSKLIVYTLTFQKMLDAYFTSQKVWDFLLRNVIFEVNIESQQKLSLMIFDATRTTLHGMFIYTLVQKDVNESVLIDGVI